MLVAAVAQNPLPGALLISVDRTAALAQPGVVRIIDLPNTIPGNSTPSGGIAVVANHYWQANRGLAAANVRWQLPSVSTDELQQKLHALVTQDQQLNAVSPDISAIYEAPLLMHAQLEPLNATVSVSRFTAEVWAPTQAQEAMQADIANALGLWHHAVIVHTPRVGGGFGRRLATDYGVTAAHIAREFDVPVKTIWSREEDSIQGRFRPTSTARLAATFDANGHIRNWESLVASMGEQARLGGLDKTPYDIAQQTGRYVPCPSDIRTGSWRSVDASQNAFFRECFIDECAQSAKIDPLEYRRLHLANNARALRVLDTLARVSDYASAQKQQRFLGIAYSEANGSVTAQAAEAIQTTNGKWRIAKVFAVVDCGIALNPNNIRAQLEGGILFGLSAAIAEEVTYRDGQLEQRNYDKYRVLTIDSAPDIHVEILETPDVDIGGIGEVGVPLIAPAATNALFAATGIRVRRLPLASSGLALAYK
jgi:isoquinoline 1-oxidoreductase beta subunit